MRHLQQELNRGIRSPNSAPQDRQGRFTEPPANVSFPSSGEKVSI